MAQDIISRILEPFQLTHAFRVFLTCLKQIGFLFDFRFSSRRTFLRISLRALRRVLLSHSEYAPFPKLSDRNGWASANQEVMKSVCSRANALINFNWPSIPATKSLLIERTGDRNAYQFVSYKKREVLGLMIIAEIHENKGRFIDPIIDGVWSICEESYWGIPAHLPKSPDYMGLADTTNPVVDLFAAETASLLAWVDYFFGDKMDQVSPRIRKRIFNEIDYRFFQPLLNKSHYWMKSQSYYRHPNNWNPWICSNWLNSVLLLEKDSSRRLRTVHKILRVLDNFFIPYPTDGGCDEGPSYWGTAAVSLYDCISLLNLTTGNSFSWIFQNEKFRNMGMFIYRVQINTDYFLNFADSSPRPKIPVSTIYRFGKDIDDVDLMKFAAFYSKCSKGEISRAHYFRNLFSLFIQDELESFSPALPLPRDVWLPNIAIMVARDTQGTADGFFVGVKGGHNAESHNHNDIGNYVVYYDGQPLLIDVGRGTYTAKTFGSDRYDIWYNCSNYHNLPTINGKVQRAGVRYCATDVHYSQDVVYSELTMDISNAYPHDAGVNCWKRTVRLNRGRNVQITEVVKLKVMESIEYHLMTTSFAEVLKPGEILIHFASARGCKRDFILKYPEGMKVSVERINLNSMEDEDIRTNWGENIYRLNLCSTNLERINNYVLELCERLE